MKKLLLIIGVFLASCGSTSPKADVFEDLRSPTLHMNIDGVLTGSTPDLGDLRRYGNTGVQLSKVYADLEQGIAAGAKHIIIRINSPGGSVDTSVKPFLNLLQNPPDDVRITCIIDGAAASLALIIFASCPYRIATDTSKVLWHSVYLLIPPSATPAVLTKKAAKELYDRMVESDKLWEPLYSKLTDEARRLGEDVVLTVQALSDQIPGFMTIITNSQLTEILRM